MLEYLCAILLHRLRNNKERGIMNEKKREFLIY